jgi:hypothetical protein
MYNVAEKHEHLLTITEEVAELFAGVVSVIREIGRITLSLGVTVTKKLKISLVSSCHSSLGRWWVEFSNFIRYFMHSHIPIKTTATYRSRFTTTDIFHIVLFVLLATCETQCGPFF